MQEIFMRRDQGGEKESRPEAEAMVLAAAVSSRNEVAVFIEESFLRALRLWCVVWRYEGGPN